MIDPFRRRALLLAGSLPLLAGCATLSALGEATQTRAIFELRPPADLPRRGSQPLGRDVIVEVPTTSGVLTTERIMIRPNRLEAAYLPDVQWAEPAPVAVQTLMVRSLDATGAFQFVGRRPLGPGGDFAIVSELMDFQAELAPDGETADVSVRLLARIVREDGVRIVASRGFAARQPSSSLEPRDIIQAFDLAMADVLRDFTGWAITSLRGG